MFLLLYVSGILITVPITRHIYTSNIIKSIINLGEMGYKLNENILNEQGEWPFDKNVNNGFLSKFTYFIPCINMLVAFGLRKNCMESIYLDAEFKNALTPMSQDEQKAFNNASSDLDKIKIITLDMVFNKIQKDIQTNMMAIRCLYVRKEKILPLSYTYSEVMKFSNLSSNIVFGNSDGRNIALLFGDNSIDFDLISFKNENPSNRFSFEKYSEEESKDKKYLIYPCMNIKDEEINIVLDEIRKERSYNNSFNYAYINKHIENKPKVLMRKK